MMAVDAKDNPLETYETVIMTDPNFGIFESPYANIAYMPDYSECEGTAEDAEKIGLKL